MGEHDFAAGLFQIENLVKGKLLLELSPKQGFTLCVRLCVCAPLRFAVAKMSFLCWAFGRSFVFTDRKYGRGKASKLNFIRRRDQRSLYSAASARIDGTV